MLYIMIKSYIICCCEFLDISIFSLIIDPCIEDMSLTKFGFIKFSILLLATEFPVNGIWFKKFGLTGVKLSTLLPATKFQIKDI